MPKVSDDDRIRKRRRTAEQRFEALLRLARRIKKAGRDTPTKHDRQIVAREHGTTHGTLASWMSRYPDAWEEAQEAAGLQTAGAAAKQTAAVAKPAAIRVEGTDGLSIRQQDACRRRVLEGQTYAAIGAAVGCHRDTVSAWSRLAAWHDYAAELQAELREATIAAHVQGASLGARARYRVLRQASKVIDLAEKDNASGFVMDVSTLKDLGGVVDRLASSAEDRAGYGRQQQDVNHGGSEMAGAGAQGGPDECERLRAALDPAGSADP